MIFIADFIACSTCFGHHYNLKTKAPNTTGSDHLYNTLELLMMGIMVPETCWASNKICNKYHLLHIVGILFPHINDDARSESLHIYQVCSLSGLLFNGYRQHSGRGESSHSIHFCRGYEWMELFLNSLPHHTPLWRAQGPFAYACRPITVDYIVEYDSK